MESKHLLVFLTCLSICVIEGKITSKLLFQDGMRHLKMPDSQFDGGSEVLQSRMVRRDAGASPSDKLMVDTTILSDPNHNEAIVHWTGANSSVLFILSRQHSISGPVPSSKLWRSADYGKTFAPVDLKDTIISYYLAAPTDKNKLLFVDLKSNKIHRTTTEGRNYTTKPGCGTSADRLVFHKTNSNYVLCYCEKERKLYVTIDFAETWDYVDSYVNPRFFWGEPGYDTDINTIHMEVLDPASGQYRYKAVTYPYPKEVTHDDSLGAIEVDSLLVINEYIFVQKSSQFATWLYVSWKRGPFKMAYFPRNHHPEDLNLLDADESQVFIAGSQKGSSIFYSVSTLYLSDVTGRFYIQSLERVTGVGLKEIEGLRGVYIANQKVGMGSESGLQTMITFDQGRQWNKIPAPQKDFNKKDTNCQVTKGCSLHFTEVISEANAPGTLLGYGTYGRIMNGYNNITMFLSTDGGVTWSFTLSNDEYFEGNILDQGGAVVAVPRSLTQEGTDNIIHYSHDEGRSWQSYSYKDDAMRVDAMLNDPGTETRTVIIFGHDQKNKNSGWVIVMVDFSKILSRACSDADYDYWFPTDQDNQHCLLGQQMKYKRRKPGSECFNGKDYEHGLFVKQCPCDLRDYECDYGYVENSKKQCVAAKWFKADSPVGDCLEGQSYNKSSGYRKVASDNCTGERPSLKPTLAPCPIMLPDGMHITLEKHTVMTVGKPVILNLVQERGSKLNTMYTWRFGDDASVNYSIKGYEQAKNQSHTYLKSGVYTVSVVAKNAAGQNNVSMVVVVEDDIKSLMVEIPHGAQVNVPVLYEVSVSDELDPFFTTKPGVHFMWKFDDEVLERDSQLTWDTSIMHTYKDARNYSVLVMALNGADSVYQVFTLPVYGTLTTVELTFADELDILNDGTLMWNEIFSKTLKNSLLKLLGTDYRRLEVVVLKQMSRTVADVSVLPRQQDMTSDETIQPLVNLLLKLPDSGFTVNLTKDDFEQDLSAKIRTAKIVTTGGDTDDKRNYVAVYVCVPILVAAIFVSMLVILYYKKTFSSSQRRYRLLHGNRDYDPEPDHLLDDTDDDDPPLDLNTEDTNQRLALSDDDQPLSGSDPLGLLSSDRQNPDV